MRSTPPALWLCLLAAGCSFDASGVGADANTNTPDANTDGIAGRGGGGGGGGVGFILVYTVPVDGGAVVSPAVTPM